MGTRELVVTVLFGTHLVAFSVLYLRRRRAALLLPMAVFALLVLSQLTAGRPISRGLRSAALVLAVPSLGLMAARVVRRLRARLVP